MGSVGIIANPAAGKDIRRLVAQGRFVSNQEKVNTLRRILAGLDAVGVERVLIMPDVAMLGQAAVDGIHLNLGVRFLEMAVFNEEGDTSKAARLMADSGVECLITLGGDGTNRAVAKSSTDVPLLPVSTGTNNVFPSMVEGTVAGMAAGLVAQGLVEAEKVTTPTKRLDVYVDGSLRDVALVDVATSTESFVGARAIWNIDSVHEIVLADAIPGSIGLSAIGAQVSPLSTGDGSGMYIRLGPGGHAVRAPIAPGVIERVRIKDWRIIKKGKPVTVKLRPCTVALDGERAIVVSAQEDVSVLVTDRGPRVVGVQAALREAALAGVFTEES